MIKKRKKVLTAWMVEGWDFSWEYMNSPFKNKKDVFCMGPNIKPHPVRVRITVEEI